MGLGRTNRTLGAFGSVHLSPVHLLRSSCPQTIILHVMQLRLPLSGGIPLTASEQMIPAGNACNWILAVNWSVLTPEVESCWKASSGLESHMPRSAADSAGVSRGRVDMKCASLSATEVKTNTGEEVVYYL